MGWFDRAMPLSGSVRFRGTVPPRPEDFAYLAALGITGGRGPSNNDLHWSLKLHHDQWGKAVVMCRKNQSPIPADLIDFDASLTDDEKHAGKAGQISISIRTEAAGKHLLRDRKSLLRWLHALMGKNGVIAMDHLAMRFWSPAALEDELMHDADVDISSLYTLHAVTSSPENSEPELDKEIPVTWLHTHGLGGLGYFDFDILNPSPRLFDRASDALRALAFAIVEDQAVMGGKFDICTGGGVRLLDVPTFTHTADAKFTDLRTDTNRDHIRNRAVVCQPPGKLSNLLANTPVPSKFLSNIPEEDLLINFSEAATELMAERARKTYRVFRSITEEFAEFDFAAVAKIGYTIDDSTANEREHLWFMVHGFTDDAVDATLGNQPFKIARMKEGDRGMHPVENLSDWKIMTPIGMITPFDTSPARAIRAKRDIFRVMMAQAKAMEERG